MPKSKGRKPKRTPRRSDRPARTGTGAGSGSYTVGLLKMTDERIASLLLSGRADPDLMVELLLPLLWLYHMSGQPGNACVDGSITLQRAYEQFGISAEPRPVDLVVRDRSQRLILYGQPEPYWEQDGFRGHCIVWLPGSRRFIDATVEQYPEVRRYRLGPICGRTTGMVQGDEASRAALDRGELVAGSHVAVQRGELTLLYTAVDAAYRDVVTEHPLVRDAAAQYHRAGVNLASHALALLRQPEVIDWIRQAPYPRLHALLDAVGTAEAHVDDDQNYRFLVAGDDGQHQDLLLDEIPLPPMAATPAHPLVLPAARADSATVQDTLESVDTQARAEVAEDPTAGDGGLPVVLFEPTTTVGLTLPDGRTTEAQAEAIIRAGFTRFLPDLDRPRHTCPDGRCGAPRPDSNSGTAEGSGPALRCTSMRTGSRPPRFASVHIGARHEAGSPAGLRPAWWVASWQRPWTAARSASRSTPA
ncbi:MAG: hypothetical protein ACRDT0_16085 [Pseudonocardiaceae bacterium]